MIYRKTREDTLLALLYVVPFLIAFFGKAFFTHHLLMITPVLCILAARGLEQYFIKSKGSRKINVRVLVILAIFIVHFCFSSSMFIGSTQSEFAVRAKIEVAEYIKNITKEDDKIWTTEADIAFFAQRLIVTPNSEIWKYQGFYEDVWGYMGTSYMGGFAGYSGGLITLTDIRQALENEKPKVIVIMKDKLVDKLIWNGINNSAYKERGLADYILTYYNLNRTLYNIEIYVRSEHLPIVVATDGSGDFNCNGTNDEVQIQAALNALTSGRTWKEKTILKGNFLVEDTIKIPSYTVLEIQGEIKLADNTNKNMFENSNVEDGDCHIEIVGGVLDGNKVNQNGGSYGIYFVNTEDVTIRNVEITQTNWEPLFFKYCKDVFVDGCKITHSGREGITFFGAKSGTTVNAWIISTIFSNNNWDGLTFEQNEQIHVTDCTFTFNGYCGIKVNSASVIKITRCNSTLNGQHGFMIQKPYTAQPAHIVLEACYAYGNQVGFNIREAKNVTIMGCTSEFNDWHGILICNSVGITVDSCHIRNNSRKLVLHYHGVTLENTTESTISNNVITDDQAIKTQNYGIYTFGKSDYNIIEGNNCQGNGDLTYDIVCIGLNSQVIHNIGRYSESNSYGN